MLSNKMKRCLSFLMAMTMIISLVPVSVLATEGDTHDHTAEVVEEAATEMEEIVVTDELVATEEPVVTDEPVATEESVVTETPVVTNPEIERLQGLINEIYGKYLPTVKTADEVQAAVDALTDIQCEDAWMDIMLLEDEIMFAQNDGLVTEADLEGLLTANPIMTAFADVVIPRAEATMPAMSVFTEHTFATYLKITDSANNSTLNGTTYTAKVEGKLWGAKTSTITLKNTLTSPAKLTFNYTVSDSETCKMNDSTVATAGPVDTVLQPDGTLKFEIKGSGGLSATTAVLTLTNLTFAEMSASSNVTFAVDSNLGSVTAGGEAVADGDVLTVSYEGTELVATPSTGYEFLAWVNGNNMLVSRSATYQLTPASDMTVRALFTNDADTPWFVVNDTQVVYHDFAAAMTAAAATTAKKVTLMADATLPEGAYSVPSGVKLLIPNGESDPGAFESESYDIGMTESAGITLYDNGNYKTGSITYRNFAYCTLKVSSGAVITCYGEINVNGHRQSNSQPYPGVSLGGHGRIELLGNGDQLIMENGSKLWCYGYIIGSGKVNMKSGSTIHELLQLCNWPGGGNANDWYNDYDQYSLFLLNQYYIQNVEAPLQLNYGATAYAEAMLNVSLVGEVAKAAVYASSSSGLFILKEGAWVLRTYDASKDRITYEQHGEIQLGAIAASIGIYNLNSANCVLPLGNNMTLRLMNDAKMTMDKRIAILPGSELFVEEGAALNVTGEIYVIDKDDFNGKNFFDRTGMSKKSSSYWFTTAGSAPSYAPLPYIATNNGLSARVSKMVRGTTTSDGKTTQRIYTNIKAANTASGKLVVNGTMTVSGSGLVATTVADVNGTASSTANKAITGEGVIKYEAAPNAGALKFDKYNGTGYGATYNGIGAVSTSKALANLAGVGTLQPLGQATYYGQGDGYWYQHAVTVSGDAAVTVIDTNGVASSALSSYDETDITGKTVVAVAANGGTVSFELADSKMPDITGTYGSVTAAPGSAEGTVCYTVSNVTGDVNIAVSDSGTATTLIVAATNAGGATMSTKQIMLPAGVVPSGYFSDKECTKAATADDIGKTVYEAATAVAAIGYETRTRDADPVKGAYTKAFMKVSEAVAAATGDETYVTVLQNRTLTDPIVIAADQNITLDLGGKTLTGKVATVFSSAKGKKLVTNNGTLRLINGKITFNGNYLTGNFKNDGNLSATVFNQGTIEYLDNVTLQQIYGSIYCAALLNGTGHTIQEIRSGSYLGSSISAGTAIVNRGTITTIGATGKTVDITGRRGIEMAGAAHLETVGASGSTVNITGGQRGIDCVDGTTVGTIGMERSTVNFITGDYTQNKSCIYADGVVTTIGGEGSTVTFSMKPKATAGMNSYGINVPGGGKVGTIGKPGSVITINGVSAQTGHVDTDSDDGKDYYYTNHMYGIYNAGTITNIGSAASDEYGASDLRINVSHSGENGHCAGIYSTATITNFGAEGAVIYINSDFTGVFNEEKPCEVTAVYGYGIYNSGKFTNGFHPDARIEVVCTQMPFRTGAVTLTLDNVTLVCTNTTKYYPLYNNTSGNSIKLDGGNFYHVLGRDQISHSPGKVTYKTGYTMSSTTRNVTLVDGTTYPCYYIAKSGAGTVTGDVPPTNPDNQGILGDVIAEYLAMEDNSDTYIVLTQDCDEPTSITLTGDVYLDLNGHNADLTGFDLNGHKLYVIDSATNAYLTNDGDQAGHIIGFDGVSAIHTSDRGASRGKHYVQVAGESGGLEFHRAAVSVTTIQYTPGQDYAVFQGVFRGTSDVVTALKDVGFRFNEETDVWYNMTDKNATAIYDMPFSYACKLEGVDSVQALLSFAEEPTAASMIVSTLRAGIADLIKGASE